MKQVSHSEITQMKSSEVKKCRDSILESQGGKCAVCKDDITDDSGVSLDHQHKFSREVLGEDGAGLIRGVLCRACNVTEGKIWNNMGRYQQPSCVSERIEWLESLVAYYKSGTYPLIHPSEKPKEPNVSKKNFNKLKKLYEKDLINGKQKKKFPVYPKSGKLNKALKALFEQYNISAYNDSAIL